MQTSEPFLPFLLNLSFKRLRFDDKLDLIERIIPIDEKACLLIDRTHSFHLKAYSQEDEESVSQQFPLPPYARNSNPNVTYSADFVDLYHYIAKKNISEADMQDYLCHLDLDKIKDLQYVYLGEYKLAVQLNSIMPVTILDLRQPNNPPVFLKDIYGVRHLISIGNGCLAWYDTNIEMVILYHAISQKRKVLNFTKIKIKQLHTLKDHVIFAVSNSHLEILDYSRNKRIKSVGFVNEKRVPNVAVHSEGNIISYTEERFIHVCKTEKGKIRWENKYDLREFDGEYEDSKYVFITHNLIAWGAKDCIRIFLLDSKNFSEHKVIESPWLGFLDSDGVLSLCCEKANIRGLVKSISSLGDNRFGIVECVCEENSVGHGQQRVSVFSLENLKIEKTPGTLQTVHSTTFQLERSIIFEEYRDPVRAIDVLDDTLAMFITERGRIFQVNLQDHVVEYLVEISDVLKSDNMETIKIDKFFVLNESNVVLVTKYNDGRYSRIVIFSLERRRVDWDSDNAEYDEDHFFYDVIKLSPGRLLASFENMDEFNLGEISQNEDEEEENKFAFYELTENDYDVSFDKLWNLRDSFVAIRHRRNPFHLYLMNQNENDIIIEKKFEAEKYILVTNVQIGGILDVKPLNTDILCIQIQIGMHESIIAVYNLQTEELMNQVRTKTSIIGTIRQCYWQGDIFQNLNEMIVFGNEKLIKNVFILQSVQDIISKKRKFVTETESDEGLCITPRNFKQLPMQDQALIYENDHHKNFICILKSPNFKLECLRILQKAVGTAYHKYIYKDIFDTIFGVKL